MKHYDRTKCRDAYLHKIVQNGGGIPTQHWTKWREACTPALHKIRRSGWRHTLVHIEQYEVKGGDLDETVENI